RHAFTFNLDTRMKVKACLRDFVLAFQAVSHKQRVGAELPSPSMDYPAGQTPITIVRRAHHPRFARGIYRDVPRIGSPCDPEASPHLRRILVIDYRRIVSGRPSLTQPLGALSIERSAGVNHHALIRERPFESQRVGMAVTWNMIRTDFADIQDSRHPPAIDANESRGVHRPDPVAA